MKNSLVVNPFTVLTYLDSEFCELVSPKPKSGLQYLNISRAELPQLHELINDLSKIRLDFLDIENDINDEERDLFYRHGVLIETENIPQKPLFSCQLDDVKSIEHDAVLSDFIVNPTFRFEPSNISSLDSWIQAKNFLPYQPTAWTTLPITEIETAYWLNAEQSEILSKFTAGEKPLLEIDRVLLSKLITAEILISPAKTAERETETRLILEQAKILFSQKGYQILYSLLPPVQMEALRNYYKQYIEQGFMPFGDNQVERRFYQHNEPLAKVFHQNFVKLMSLIAGEEVIPSYVYAASYIEGAILEPHLDREACQYSFSFQIDYQPETDNHLSTWALYLAAKSLSDQDSESFKWENFLPNDKESKAVYLASGDALAYKGCELIHYRKPLPEGHQSTSLFFHYVPTSFEGNLF